MINNEALVQTKSLSTQLSLTTNQRNPGCLVMQHGQRGLQHKLHEFVGQQGEDGDGRGRRGRAPAAVRLRAKQYKRPDMNKDLRLGFASNDFTGAKWKNLTGTAGATARRWSPSTTRTSPACSGGCAGLPGPAGRGGSLAGPAGTKEAEEAIRNMADARRRTIKAVYEDPRTGFGSIAQTLQQAQVRPFKHLDHLSIWRAFFLKLVSASAYEDFCSLPRGSRRRSSATRRKI